MEQDFFSTPSPSGRLVLFIQYFHYDTFCLHPFKSQGHARVCPPPNTACISYSSFKLFFTGFVIFSSRDPIFMTITEFVYVCRTILKLQPVWSLHPVELCAISSIARCSQTSQRRTAYQTTSSMATHGFTIVRSKLVSRYMTVSTEKFLVKCVLHQTSISELYARLIFVWYRSLSSIGGFATSSFSWFAFLWGKWAACNRAAHDAIHEYTAHVTLSSCLHVLNTPSTTHATSSGEHLQWKGTCCMGMSRNCAQHPNSLGHIW